MINYQKPTLIKFSVATTESMAAFNEAFNSPLDGLEDEFVFSYDMSSLFGTSGAPVE